MAMPVTGLNHLNIVSADLDGTVAFYHALLGLERAEVPVAGAAAGGGCWLTDAEGQAVIHLQRFDPARHGSGRSAGPTGAIDHVAFNCRGHADIAARCAAMGLAATLREHPEAGFRQIVVTDPNDILLELNFVGD